MRRIISRVSRRVWAWGLTATVATTLVAVEATGRAQGRAISDGDRQAARELFMAGVRAQNEGKFQEALAYFERSRRVVDAPTNVLRIAQCEAALGKYVEAVESYRELARFPLASDAPQAFHDAQAQGAAELPTVESKVARLTLDVTPSDAHIQSVNIDGEAIHVALVGVARPVNPGTHRLQVHAEGFVVEEQLFTLRPGETQRLNLVLKRGIADVGHGAGPHAPPPPAPYVAPTSSSAGGAGSGSSPGTSTGSIPPPFEPALAAASESDSPTGILLGADLGFANQRRSPFARRGQYSNNDSTWSGGYVGLDGALRFARVFSVGVFANVASLHAEDMAQSPDMTQTSLGAYLGYVGRRDRLAFFGNVGPSVISNSYFWDPTPKAPLTNGKESITETGYGLRVNLGLNVPVASSFRLVPKLEVTAGRLGFESATTGFASVHLGLNVFWNRNL